MKFISSFILFLIVSISLHSQTPINDTIVIDPDKLIGRWEEVKRTTVDNEEIPNSKPHHFIFTDDKLFHIGDVGEGVILFKINGRYTIDKEFIKVMYFDASRNKNSRPQKMELKVIAWAEDEINAYLYSADNKKYYIRLKKVVSQ